MKPSGFWNMSWLGGKTTYTEEKWLGGAQDPQGDRGRLEDFYLNHGYVTVRIGQPRIEYTDGKRVSVPLRNGREIVDWRHVRDTSHAAAGWRGSCTWGACANTRARISY